MRRALYAIAVLAGAVVPAYAAEHGAKILDDAFVRAFGANDLEATIALYAPEARVFPPDAMEQRGKAIREGFAAFLGAYTVKEFKILEAAYETSGSLSAGWGRYSMMAVPKKGGEPVKMEGRFTSVAKKIGGKWLYVADHASVALPPPPPEFPKPASMPGAPRR